LQALAADRIPPEAELAALRRALRRVIAHHLGSRGLKSWELMAALRPLGAARRSGDVDGAQRERG